MPVQCLGEHHLADPGHATPSDIGINILGNLQFLSIGEPYQLGEPLLGHHLVRNVLPEYHASTRPIGCLQQLGHALESADNPQFVYDVCAELLTYCTMRPSATPWRSPWRSSACFRYFSCPAHSAFLKTKYYFLLRLRNQTISDHHSTLPIPTTIACALFLSSLLLCSFYSFKKKKSLLDLFFRYFNEQEGQKGRNRWDNNIKTLK